MLKCNGNPPDLSGSGKNAKILLTIAAAVLFTVAMTATPLWATDYYVRTGGLDDPIHNGLINDDAHAWLTIQYAIDNVSAGNIINVAAGTYNEQVTIDKSINLIGDGESSTTIDAGGSGTVVTVSVGTTGSIFGVTIT